MQRFALLVWSAAFFLQSYAARTQVNDSLSKILDKVYSDDQQWRNRLSYYRETYGYNSTEMKVVLDSMKVSDSLNVLKVTAILDKYGWPGPEEVGVSGNRALFLVIQHADLDIQLKYLPMARGAVEAGKLKAGSLALLEDRIAVRQGRDQVYGSQIGCDMISNTYYLMPVTDPDNLDKRRAAMNLPLIQTYLRGFNMSWDPEQYKKDLPALRLKINADRKNE